VSDEPEEFHPYVRLLLARMKSNPDDFTYEANLVPLNTEMFFTEAEKAAVWAARREIALGRNHSNLMEQILKANEPKENKYVLPDGSQYKVTERYSHTQLDRDAYLLQSQRMQNSLQAAQQSALMQSQQAYSGPMPPIPSTTVTPELIKSLNKLVGR